MDDDQFRRDSGAGSNAPVFVNTKDLVHFSLGIEGQTEDQEEMDVAYDDSETNASDIYGSSTSNYDPNVTQGLSTFYNVSEEDEQVRNITNEYLEGQCIIYFGHSNLLTFYTILERLTSIGTFVV